MIHVFPTFSLLVIKATECKLLKRHQGFKKFHTITEATLTVLFFSTK